MLPVDAFAVEVGGHAHYLCKDMHVWAASPDGARASIFWIDDWDFNWQNRYQYATPLALPPSAMMRWRRSFSLLPALARRWAVPTAPRDIWR